jgi:hypothetical protein
VVVENLSYNNYIKRVHEAMLVLSDVLFHNKMVKYVQYIIFCSICVYICRDHKLGKGGKNTLKSWL